MSLFKRKITYFYEHDKGNLGNTAGFLKLEIRGEKVKIIINIQDPPGHMDKLPDLYFYHEAGDHLAAIKVGTVERLNGMLIFHQRTEWQNVFGTKRDLYTFDGVAVVYHKEHYFIGDFLDKNRIEFPLECKENNVVENIERELIENTREKKEVEKLEPAIGIVDEKQRSDTWYEEIESGESLEVKMGGQEKESKEKGQVGEIEEAKEKKRVREIEEKKSKQVGEIEEVKEKKGELYTKCENCPYQKKRMEQEEYKNAFEKMLAEYPQLPMYGVQELMNCVRIHPKDIGKLDMRNWKLGVNSFLTHGFYTYQYLMLGKMIFENGKEQPIIGVPGVYTNREKYVANMFGFEQFIPIKKTGTKTGEFGYWIVELV